VGQEGQLNFNKDIYTSIKPYKRKRLFYSKYFRSLYNGQHEPALTLTQYEFKICTHCWLQRCREEDIITIMGWWYAKHSIKGNWWHLRHVVIPETYQRTRKTVKAQKKVENDKAKAKRLGGKDGESRRLV
jgi:hypothetical protein